MESLKAARLRLRDGARTSLVTLSCLKYNSYNVYASDVLPGEEGLTDKRL